MPIFSNSASSNLPKGHKPGGSPVEQSLTTTYVAQIRALNTTRTRMDLTGNKLQGISLKT